MKKNTNRRPLAAASSFTTFHRVSDRSFLFISSQLDIVNGFFSLVFFFLLFLHLGLNLTFWIRVFQKLGYYTSRKARKFQFLRCQTIRLVQSRLQSFSLFFWSLKENRCDCRQANKHNKINRYYKTGCWWIEEKAAEKRSHQHIIKPFHRVLYLISD